MSPWINYHHLYYFKVIAEEGSVSNAAAKLRLGQPTLSAQLKQFESTLGVQLFARNNKRLSLTEQGQVALAYAKSIFRLGGEMYEVLHDRLDGQRLHLQIGALDSVAKQVTLQLTKAANEIAPCMVSVEEGKLQDILSGLAAHRLDLVVTNFLPSSLGAQPLLQRVISKSPVGVYGAAKFKALRRNFPASLQGQSFVLPTYDSKLRYDVEQWMATKKIKINIVAETQDISLKKMMAIDGLGLIPAAVHTVRRQVLAGELIQLGQLDAMTEQLILVTADKTVEHPLAAKLMKSFSL
jgi:LysR family transcriptional activator of nhaA